MSDQERFARALKVYTDLGLSAARTIGQLLRAGHPHLLVRQHFPDAPDAWFNSPGESYATYRVPAPGGPQPPAEQCGPGSPHSVQAITQRLFPKPRAEAPARVEPAAIDTHEGISFQYVPLIQCSFPHTDPGREATFSRRNGWLELTLSTARPETGLPYGVPARLLTIYCASEAVRQQSPEIYLGRSVHEFLRLLDIPISRGERGSLRTYANQLLRLIHCAISIDENIRDAGGRSGLHIRQALFVQEARLWWDEVSGIGQGSSLVLSPVLYESIVERSAPLSTDAIRQLRKSPMDLDVYAWLVHRLFTLTRPSSISWAQLSGQFGHNYGELRYFRRYFGESLQRVLKVYPEARLKCSDQGILLLPSRPHVEPRALR
jgi:Plasmid encoded RepA protein